MDIVLWSDEYSLDIREDGGFQAFIKSFNKLYDRIAQQIMSQRHNDTVKTFTIKWHLHELNEAAKKFV